MTDRRGGVWYGWVTFAAVLLCVLGVLNILEGLVALLQRQVTFIDGESLVVVDLTGLGIVMIAFGALLTLAGAGLFARSNVARIAAVVIVALHALAQIGSLGAYPVWSLLMITLDVLVLFALTVHWSDAPKEIPAPAPPMPMPGNHRADRPAPAFPVNPSMNPSVNPPMNRPAQHAAPTSGAAI